MPGDHGGGCSCRDEATAVGIGQSKWLNSAIAIDQVVCLNSEEGEIKDVVRKTYDERLDDDKGFVRSPEDDNELLVHIPFSSPVALTSIYVIGGEAGRHPRSVRLFHNPASGSGFDFSDAVDVVPTQSVELAEDLCGAVEYPVKAHRFMNCSHLVMHFPQDENAGEAKELYWLGFKGIPTEWKREAVVTVYESQANLADHEKAPDEQAAARNNPGM